MAIQTTTFKKRLRQRSELSPQARLVALTIADLRFEHRVRAHEPLPVSLNCLADECGMSRRTLDRYLNECISAGWIIARKVYRDGRQQPNEYLLCDPTDTDAEGRRLPSVMGSEKQLLRAGVATKPRRRLPTVLRSKNNGDSDDAPRSGGGGITEQETSPARDQTPEPSPAPPVAPPPTTSNEKVTDRNRAYNYPDEWTPVPTARPRLVNPVTGDNLMCPEHGSNDPKDIACVGCMRARIARQNLAEADAKAFRQMEREMQLERQRQRRERPADALPLIACVPPELADAPTPQKLAFMEANPDYRNPNWRRIG